MRQAKSILGGSIKAKPLKDNGVPGPGQYKGKPIMNIPGIKIMQSNHRAKWNATDLENI